jgi:hypothetical protein
LEWDLGMGKWDLGKRLSAAQHNVVGLPFPSLTRMLEWRGLSVHEVLMDWTGASTQVT